MTFNNVYAKIHLKDILWKSEDISLNLGNLNKGEYTVKVAINKGSVFAYFATDAEFDGLYYTLFTFKV